MIPLDVLRRPSPFDPSAPAYKEWLHLNLFDHASGAIGLLNLSLHGSPEDARALAVAATLLYLPGQEWIGGAVVYDQAEARVGPTSIAVPGAAIAVHHASATVHVSVLDNEQRLSARIRALADGAAFSIEQPLPLGSGWISWYVVPSLTVSGSMRAADQDLALDGALGYHDHNWGRWHWGDDLGWDWGTFAAASPGPTIVYARTTDRRRQKLGPAWLLVRYEGHERRFPAASVSSTTSGIFAGPIRRVPGAMAALHQDRAAPALPREVRIEARYADDALVLDFTAEAAVQIICADPVRRGFGFIHELAGAFRMHGTIGGKEVIATGLAVFEHVD
jgi:hypothetical protein